MKQRKKLKYFFIIIITISIFTLIKSKTNSDTVTPYVLEENEIAKEKESLVTENSSFPSDVYGTPVYTELIDINEETRPGIKRKIKYIVIHETDNFEARDQCKKSC